LSDKATLTRLYPADLFDPALIQTLRLIPTEYLYFYYSQRKAYENQLKAGASRGEELARLNDALFQQLRSEDGAQGLATYRQYLLRRNSSYMKLEANAESASNIVQDEYDPFETVTGYHRIALELMTALVSTDARQVVLNVPNHGAIQDLDAADVVEVPCAIDCNGARPVDTGALPDSVRGLLLAVKEYERTTIRAAAFGSRALAQLAMTENPIIGQWELAGRLVESLVKSDPVHLGYLQ
jgi:6-phospho-beta-glucosidase